MILIKIILKFFALYMDIFNKYYIKYDKYLSHSQM
jgi:hypothetical protein